MKNKYHIVLTGGPCAGKTSATNYLKDHLSKLGFKVVLVPEVATLVINSGILHGEHLSIFDFQKTIFKNILDIENNLTEFAKHYQGSEKIIYLHDRGLCDARAYLSSTEEFEKLLKFFQISMAEIFFRYDGIVHLVTTADGAEDYYNNSNNSARLENSELARELDEKTMKSWQGHEKIYMIENSGDFQQKCAETLEAVLSIVGYPKPFELEKKYIVDKTNLEFLTKNSPSVLIEQDFLLSNNGCAERVRKITQGENVKYKWTSKEPIPNGIGSIEKEKEISEEEYKKLLQKKDPKRKTIQKNRYYKFFGKKYFSIDIFIDPKIDFIMLEIEFESQKKASEFVIPDEIAQLPGFKDVTNIKEYSNWNLSLK